MIITKKWKETTKICRVTDQRIDDASLCDLANIIISELPNQKPGIVWAQVELICRIKMLEEQE